jgi:hypothetical protein
MAHEAVVSAAEGLLGPRHGNQLIEFWMLQVEESMPPAEYKVI